MNLQYIFQTTIFRNTISFSISFAIHTNSTLTNLSPSQFAFPASASTVLPACTSTPIPVEIERSVLRLFWGSVWMWVTSTCATVLDFGKVYVAGCLILLFVASIKNIVSSNADLDKLHVLSDQTYHDPENLSSKTRGRALFLDSIMITPVIQNLTLTSIFGS
ncbi:hypothetical protein HYFRA_00006398 [Hymenoscyphus fraxineus]|uniref:Uncharacterized protein n=1 Tax=Hymenoscyphus fraxineus TaxID=746836 RepID=A0A9N9KPZ7_9HELO|nr:hypothetical protein HYFRA_00006398 [Hymenoscyphus fraxineus]